MIINKPSYLNPAFKRIASYAFSVTCLFFTGCLQTRAETGESDQKNVIQSQMKTIQHTAANSSGRFEETEEQLRLYNGRIEILERKTEELMSARNKGAQKDEMDRLNKKLDAYEESISKLEAEVAGLRQAMLAAPPVSNSSKTISPSSGPLQTGDQHFDDRQWREAVLSYEKYREANPKGKSWAKATLRIGQCFQEMGMSKEAKSFFVELVEKAPKSSEAKIAQAKLKMKPQN